MKKGWRTPFSFKITPRRARRTGPQALFVGSLAQKRSFFTKLARRPQGLRARLSKKAKKEKKRPGKKLEKGVENPFFI